MSRAGQIRDSTPYCVECGRFKPASERTPWMQHPIDYGWWCGCEPEGDDPTQSESLEGS